MLTITEVVDGDFARIAADIRREDAAEIAALGYEPEKGLRVSALVSRWTKVLRDPAGVPLCVFGLQRLADCGVPWMIGTNGIDAHRRSFMRHSRRVVRRMLDECPVLTNVVDSRNVRAIRWLEALGFAVDHDSGWSPPGTDIPFHLFTMSRDA